MGEEDRTITLSLKVKLKNQWRGKILILKGL